MIILVSMDWFTNNWWNNLLRKVIFFYIKVVIHDIMKLSSKYTYKTKEVKQMDKKVKKRDMMLDDDIDELEDTEDILAALRDFFEEDPLLKAFFNGMKMEIRVSI